MAERETMMDYTKVLLALVVAAAWVATVALLGDIALFILIPLLFGALMIFALGD